MDSDATSAFPTDGGTLHTPLRLFKSFDVFIYTTLVLLIPLTYLITRDLASDLARTHAAEQRRSDAWRAAWCTKDWYAFFGLLYYTLDEGSPHHPFETLYFKTVQRCCHDLRRNDAIAGLLERGIIPLHIHDGGLQTTQVKTFSLLKRLPFVQLPLYRQAKSRAYMVFVVPQHNDPEQKTFINMIKNNDRGFEVSLSRKDKKNDVPTLGTSRNNPTEIEDWQPLTTGAESAIEALLPFMPDKLIEKYDDFLELPSFFNHWYDGELLEESDVLSAKVSCLHDASVALVRVESKTWAPVELEQFVFDYAKSAGLEAKYSYSVIKGAMRNKLESVGIRRDQY